MSKPILTRYEAFALGQVFSTYPTTMDYAEICAHCEDDTLRDAYDLDMETEGLDDEMFQLCEAYENEWYSNIPGIMDNLIECAKHHFPESRQRGEE